MKRNILTIIIMAMCCINLILSAVVVFAVVPAANKTNKLISQVSQIVNLETEVSKDSGSGKVDPSKIVSHEIEGDLSFNLKRGTDGVDHYGRLDSIVLSLNQDNADYKKLEKTISANESFITDIVSDVISSYTYDEAIADKSQMRDDILKKIQAHFNSDFIFSISLSNLRFQ